MVLSNYCWFVLVTIFLCHYVQAFKPRGVQIKRRLSMFPEECSGPCEGTVIDLMLRPGKVCPESIDYKISRFQEENFMGSSNEICKSRVSTIILPLIYLYLIFKSLYFTKLIIELDFLT